MYAKEDILKRGYKVLVVDDDPVVANMTLRVLDRSGFTAKAVNSGAEGIAVAEQFGPHLVLLDKRMPGMDGFETMRRLKENAKTSAVPIVFLTSDDDTENEIRCFEEGASDFIKKPFVPDIMIQRIMRIIELDIMLKELDSIVDERTRELRKKEQESRELSDQIILALARAVDAKDEYTNGHSQRVAEYAVALADKLHKDETYKEELYYMGMLHDIGKIGIPDEIIHKTTKLTDEEYEKIKQHPTIGSEILGTIRAMPHLAIGARYHHEHFDGSGYPEGLKGYEIPEEARILAVADSYDAMTSKRTYHNTRPQDYARSEIEKGKGTQFDPEMADAMLSLIDEDVNYHMQGSN
ncbi:MAG: response regulator [Lachnospiraceae bacterium]|nr:response regulator [Lachnospiraceae bacterium]